MSADARRHAKAEAQAAIDAATRQLERGAIDEATWQRRVSAALAAAYLLEADPRWQSGSDSDAALWRQSRELILEAVDTDGTLLDIGCATGHLMECLASWGRERGRRLSVYGLELNGDLARAARRRLPELADRIFEGNAVDWQPAQRFRFVHTGLEYVPTGRGAFLVGRLLRDVVEARGRLIVGPVGMRELPGTIAAFEEAGVGRPQVHQAADRNGETRTVLWAEKR